MENNKKNYGQKKDYKKPYDKKKTRSDENEKFEKDEKFSKNKSGKRYDSGKKYPKKDGNKKYDNNKYEKSEDSEKRTYGKKYGDDKNKKTYGKKRYDNGENKSENGDKKYGKKDFGKKRYDNGENKSDNGDKKYGKKDFGKKRYDNGENKSDNGDKKYGKKDFGKKRYDNGENKSENGDKKYGKKDFGKKRYENRDNNENGERKYGKKNYGKKRYDNRDNDSVNNDKRYDKRERYNNEEEGSDRYSKSKSYRDNGDRKQYSRNNDSKSYKNKYSKYKNDKYAEENIEEDDGSTRLNKFIASSGICSRRQADEYIESGQITVNDVVVTDLGTKILPTDVVKFKDQVLKGERQVYIVMNKPKNFITTLDDPKNRNTVIELFKGRVKERVYPVGRLDRNTTGVLLFTNDGEITRKLTHPSGGVQKVYVATLDNDITKNDMVQLAEGIELDDGPISVDSIYYLSDSSKSKVVVEIHSGRNRIVRRMFEHLGYDVRNLDRIEFAGVSKKDLLRGQWRYMSEKEIGFLKMLAGKIKA